MVTKLVVFFIDNADEHQKQGKMPSALDTSPVINFEFQQNGVKIHAHRDHSTLI